MTNDLLQVTSIHSWRMAWGNEEPQIWTNTLSPCVVEKAPPGTYLWLQADISKSIPAPQIFLTHVDQPLELFANRTLVTTRGNLSSSEPAAFNGYSSYLFDLPAGTSTLTLKIRPSNPTHAGLCGQVAVATGSTMSSHILKTGLSHLIFPTLYLLAGLILLAFFSRRSTGNALVGFGMFLLSLGAWLIAIPQNFLKDFVLPASGFWIFLDQTALYFLAFALIFFLESLFPKRIWKLLRHWKYIYLTIALIAPFLHFFTTWTYIKTNIVFNMTMLPFLITLMSNVIAIARFTDKRGILLASSMVLFLLFALHDWLVGIWFLASQPLLMGFGFFFLVSTFGFLAVTNMRRLELEQRKIQNEHHIFKRIAQATQMVAHDVRRPFTMLRTAIDLIRNAKSSDQVLAKATSLIRDVEDSLNNVDNLIGDIIAISNQEPLKTAPQKPENILGDVIQETLRQHPEAHVDFDFSLHHSKQVAVDENKIRRVVSNILTNAFQAMQNHGIVSISTADKLHGDKDVVEISIHNSGPPIAADDIPHVFDSFFTKGKQGGTGLGLAIAKTFIEAHGGDIACESSENHGVRFYFSLEAIGESYSPHVPKIASTAQMIDETPVTSPSAIAAMSSDNSSNKKAFRILIVEDELIFQQGLLDEIERFSIDGYEINATVAHNADTAHKYVAETHPDLILLDIDLGPSSPDGLQFLRDIRAQGIKTYVCIHSNRTFFDTGITPADLGADIALPKPMNTENLTFIITEALKKGVSATGRPKVVVVDDEECYLTAWKETMTDAEVLGFLDPELFWDEVIEKPDVLQSISCIIFDFFFRGTDIDKLQLVGSLRTKGFCGPIILSTNAPYDNKKNSTKSRFDHTMKKRAMLFSELKAIPEIASAFQKQMNT